MISESNIQMGRRDMECLGGGLERHLEGITPQLRPELEGVT